MILLTWSFIISVSGYIHDYHHHVANQPPQYQNGGFTLDRTIDGLTKKQCVDTMMKGRLYPTASIYLGDNMWISYKCVTHHRGKTYSAF